MKHEYPIHIFWSPEDEAYIATAPQLDGCMADGQTPEEAVANLRVVIQEWIEVAQEDKRPIPEPVTILDIAQQQHAQIAMINKAIQSAVNEAVGKIVNEIASARETPDYHPRFFLPAEDLAAALKSK